MKCSECNHEYPEPEMIGSTAHFICENCGQMLEIYDFHPYTRDQIIEKIEQAFSGVVLGQGVGLFEAQAIDDYETESVQKCRREDDEKLDWRRIPFEVLQKCHSSLSFFDADGIRFHLPAYIVASLKNDVEDPLFHLTVVGELMESKLSSLSSSQTKAVIDYLTWCLTNDDYMFYHSSIAMALKKYWWPKLKHEQS